MEIQSVNLLNFKSDCRSRCAFTSLNPADTNLSVQTQMPAEALSDSFEKTKNEGANNNKNGFLACLIGVVKCLLGIFKSLLLFLAGLKGDKSKSAIDTLNVTQNSAQSPLKEGTNDKAHVAENEEATAKPVEIKVTKPTKEVDDLILEQAKLFAKSNEIYEKSEPIIKKLENGRTRVELSAEIQLYTFKNVYIFDENAAPISRIETSDDGQTIRKIVQTGDENIKKYASVPLWNISKDAVASGKYGVISAKNVELQQEFLLDEDDMPIEDEDSGLLQPLGIFQNIEYLYPKRGSHFKKHIYCDENGKIQSVTQTDLLKNCAHSNLNI